jgi:hypothetical protein
LAVQVVEAVVLEIDDDEVFDTVQSFALLLVFSIAVARRKRVRACGFG